MNQKLDSGRQLQAPVFNIQKFSLHDGPGIRTTVFLKGCPLACRWCANPESQSTRIQILYKKDNCQFCGRCVQACVHNALSIDKVSGVHCDESLCQGCLACEKACLNQALSHEGEMKSVQDVLEVCLQDQDFYEESQGGVTISGGEGMIHPDFVEALVAELKERGIHTAIETTGCVSNEIFCRLAPAFDLLLFDVKQADAIKHQAGTGISNQQILKNLRWAARSHLDVLVRIPVIPGFNDQTEDARSTARLLREYGLNKVQLLPFHQMGERKYEFLHREYEYASVKALHPEDLQEYRQVFLDEGLDCFF